MLPMLCTGDQEGKYKGVIDCFIKTARTDGLLAFYKGFGPNFVRLGSWNVIMFLTLEQVGSWVEPATLGGKMCEVVHKPNLHMSLLF